MAEPYLGEIRMFAFEFAPQSWALCNGQILPISQNQALFALLGTNYGGNGINTFALPDLRSRVAVHQGEGSGLQSYFVGEQGGLEDVTLTTAELPAHNHSVGANAAPGTSARPGGNVPGRTHTSSYGSAPDGTTMNAGMIGVAGDGFPHENRQPFLAVTFCIALAGIFPSQG